MNPDPEHQRRLKKAAEMMVEKQVNMIKQIMIKSAMGIIEGGMEAVQEAKQKPAKREWVGLTDEESVSLLVKANKPKRGQQFTTAPEMAAEFGRLVSELLKERNT